MRPELARGHAFPGGRPGSSRPGSALDVAWAIARFRANRKLLQAGVATYGIWRRLPDLGQEVMRWQSPGLRSDQRGRFESSKGIDVALWIILTVMAAATAVLLLALFLRRFDGAPADDVARPGAAGRSTRLARTPLSPRERIFAGVAAVTVLTLGGVVLQGVDAGAGLSATGSRGIESGRDAVEQLAAAASGQTTPSSAQQTGQPSTDEMIERLAARLKQNPNDSGGWRMLGWAYARTERFVEAASAYRKAIELAPDVAELRSALGVTLVSVANGTVTDEAKELFAAAVKLDALDPQGRFYLGLARSQAGDGQGALEDWITFMKQADPQASWLPELRERITDLAADLGVDVSARLGPAPGAGGGVLATLRASENGGAAAPKGPTTADVKNAEATSPADRTAMIRGMVDGLARRLEQSPRDAEGWIMLMRSRKVLGESDGARQTLDRALSTFADAPQERERIAAAGRDLGLSQ
jgi:cytochrome c-type biogenesis protein CcmH